MILLLISIGLLVLVLILIALVISYPREPDNIRHEKSFLDSTELLPGLRHGIKKSNLKFNCRSTIGHQIILIKLFDSDDL